MSSQTRSSVAATGPRPREVLDRLLDPAAPESETDDFTRKILEISHGGHTHRRMLRAYRGREIVNPGSVGLAYQFFPDGRVRVPPWAEFAILSAADHGAVSVDFRRLPYDRDATIRAMTERGMPHAAWWAADWR